MTRIAPAGDTAFCPTYHDAVRADAKRHIGEIVAAGACPEDEAERVIAELGLGDA